MFGDLCFTIGGRICCCVNERGLLVKVDSKSVGQRLTQAGVEPAQMGDRQMRGFVLIRRQLLTDEALRGWVARGLRTIEPNLLGSQ
jgi:TfoX N-terminal domain